MICYLIDSGPCRAFENMAIDEALAASCSGPILRFYQWAPKAVSIGYNQKIGEISAELCEKSNIDIVRRITGGKAVFHDEELTYSFIVPEKSGMLPKEIDESYKKIAQVLIVGLKKFKINAQVKKQPDRISTPVCFTSSNWYELVVGGKKISGSAQRRLNGVILQHGSILLDFDPRMNSQIFSTTKSNVNVSMLHEKITSIKKETNAKISIKKFKREITGGFRDAFDFDFRERGLSGQERAMVEKLLAEKYWTKEWNQRI